MKFLALSVIVFVALFIIVGCDSGTAETEKKSNRIPPISVTNPFDNATFTWDHYNDLDQIEGTVHCTGSGVGTLSWKIYDTAGTIVDDYARYPVYIKEGETKKVTIFSNSTDLRKAVRIVVSVNEEE